MNTPHGPGWASNRPGGQRGSWPSRHKGLTVAAAVLAFLVVLGAIGSLAGTGTTETAVADRARSSAAGPDVSPAPAATESASPTTTPPPTSSSPTPAARPSDKTPKGRDGTITRHVDGDTIYVDGVSVRLIGIDTPETVHPSEPVECYGRKASAQLAGLLPLGAQVRVVYDVERTDRYGRDLAYLFRLRDGLFVNAAMVRRGYAGTLTIQPNVRYADLFVQLARQARTHDRGLWSTCSDEHEPLRTKAPASPKQEQPGSAGNCLTGYDPCLPPYPPDLDCADVDGPIRVSGDDPHGLDADGDGVACE